MLFFSPDWMQMTQELGWVFCSFCLPWGTKNSKGAMKSGTQGIFEEKTIKWCLLTFVNNHKWSYWPLKFPRSLQRAGFYYKKCLLKNRFCVIHPACIWSKALLKWNLWTAKNVNSEQIMSLGVTTSEQNKLLCDFHCAPSTMRPSAFLQSAFQHCFYSSPDNDHMPHGHLSEEIWTRSTPTISTFKRNGKRQAKRKAAATPGCHCPTTPSLILSYLHPLPQYSQVISPHLHPPTQYLHVGWIPLETFLGSNKCLIPLPKAEKCIWFIAQQHGQVPRGNPVRTNRWSVMVLQIQKTVLEVPPAIRCWLLPSGTGF